MELRETKISGCYELFPRILEDNRGYFVKTFHEDWFKQHQLETHFAEEYFSLSHQGVIRGLHFQVPPHEHTKIVYCVQGNVTDVVLDLRKESPTYGQFETFSLSAERANLVYISPGLAHGFEVLSESALMMYKVSTVYNSDADCGILWNSVSVPWHTKDPIISNRDQSFQVLADFRSPF